MYIHLYKLQTSCFIFKKITNFAYYFRIIMVYYLQIFCKLCFIFKIYKEVGKFENIYYNFKICKKKLQTFSKNCGF